MTISRVLPLLATTLLAVAPGCDFLFNPTGDAIVNVSAAHHRVPDATGSYPLATAAGPRVFVTDLGYTVTLQRALFNIDDISLVKCSGDNVAIDLYARAQVRDVIARNDFEAESVGTGEFPAGDYCGASVLYTPFQPTAGSTIDPELVGNSLLMSGVASKDGQAFNFVITTNEPIEAAAELVRISPTGIHLDGDRVHDVTVSIAYDTMLDTVDFATLDQGHAADRALTVLAAQTRFSNGNHVAAPDQSATPAD